MINFKLHGIETKDAARTTVGSVCTSWRFEVFVVKDASRKVKPSRWSHHKTIGRMMRICRVDAVEDTFLDVGFVVAVCVFQKEDVRSHRHQHSAIPEFESRWIVQTVRERNATISFSVAVVVGKNQQLVVHFLPRIPVRIGGPCRHPQATISVYGALDGVDKFRELFF